MFTINELMDKRAEFESACQLTIKQLLSDTGRIEFDIDDVENCPYCIGDDYMGIVDGIIKAVDINKDTILITYVNNKDTSTDLISEIEYLVHCDYIDLITQIQNKLKNGKTNLG